MSDLHRLAVSTTKLLRNTKVLALFLLDGSVRILPKDFDGPLKETVKSLITMLRDGSLVSLIQFSSTITIHIAPTTNLAAASASVASITQMKQSTNTTDALKEAQKITLSPLYDNYTKVIFVLTDGYPNEKENLAVVSKQLVSSGNIIVAIGIGANISFESLTLMSNDPSKSFKVSDFNSLCDLMRILQAAPDEDPCIVNFTPETPELKTGLPLNLIGQLENLTLHDIPAGAIVKFPRNKYFQQQVHKVTKSVESGETYDFKIKLCVNASANASDFPSEITWTLNTSNSQMEGIAVLQTGLLRGDFYYDTPINILLYGKKGSGKSATINSLIQCLSLDTTVKHPATIGQSLEHITTKYSRFPISTYLKGPGKNKIPFVFWDTWGYSADEEHKNVDITAFVKGYVTTGLDRASERDNSYSLNYENSRAREMHVVLMVVSITARRDPHIMAPMKKAIQLINKANDMSPIVVVTHIDAFSDPELESEKEEMLKEMSVDPMNVFFLRNYVSEIFSDKFIDQSSRGILLAIKNKAETHVLKKPPSYYKDADWREVHPAFIQEKL